MDATKTKSCPCCGSPAKVVHEGGYETFESDDWWVECKGCGLQTRWHKSRREAVQSWNHRVPSTDNDTAEFKIEVHEVSEFLKAFKSVLNGREK